MSRRLGWLRPLVSYALHIVAEEQAVTFERLQIQLSFRIEKIYNGVIIRFPACCKIHAQSQMQEQVHVGRPVESQDGAREEINDDEQVPANQGSHSRAVRNKHPYL